MCFTMDSILHSGPSSSAARQVNSVPTSVYLSRTQHSQSGGAHGGKRWLNPQAIYEWQRYASVPNPRDVIWRAILPCWGKSTPHSGFGHWKWRSEPLALESIPMEPLGCHAAIPGWQHASIKLATHAGRSGFVQLLASCYLKGQGQKAERGGTPQPKRTHYYEEVDPTCINSDSDSEEVFGEDLAEPFKPNSFYKKSPKVDVPEAIESCL